MLFVGISEELISRGPVLGFFHDAFGSNTQKGVYLRKHNIFALMILNAVSDIAAMVSSGYLNGKADLKGTIIFMNHTVLIFAGVYVAAGIFILRDEKMHYVVTDNPTGQITADAVD